MGWMAYYKSRYNLNKEMVKLQADKFMEMFDNNLANENYKREMLEGKVDEDGFTLVTRKKAVKTANAAANLLKKRKKQKKKQGTVGDFYVFQRRERKRNQLKELREKFEQDKNRVERLKNSRKYKPF